MSVHDQAAVAVLTQVALAADGAVLGLALAYVAVRSVLKFKTTSSALHKLKNAPSVTVSDLRSVLTDDDGDNQIVIVRGVVETKANVTGGWMNHNNVLHSHESDEKAVILQRTQTCIYNEWRGFFGWTSDFRSLFRRHWKEQESLSMRTVSSRKNTLSVNTSQNVSAGTILEPPSRVNANLSVNPVNESKGELQLKLTALKEISKFITRKKGDLPSIFSMESAMKTKLDLNVSALATALEDGKFCTGEDITLVLCEFSKLKVLLEAFDPSPQKTERSVFMKNLEGVLDWLDSSRPKLDDFLKRYGNEKPSSDQMVADFCKRYGSQKLKARQMVVSKCSSSKTEVEQVGHDARNKTRKGNKGKKGKQSKGKKK